MMDSKVAREKCEYPTKSGLGRRCNRDATTKAFDPFYGRTLRCCKQHKKIIEREAQNFVLYD